MHIQQWKNQPMPIAGEDIVFCVLSIGERKKNGIWNKKNKYTKSKFKNKNKKTLAKANK